MSLEFKQSTSATVMLGPFVDSSGVALTGLTIAAAEIQIAKHGSSSFVSKNSGGATHVAAGYYQMTLDSTDLNTIGRIQVYALDGTTAHMPVYLEGMVRPANVADALYLGTDTLQVDVQEINGNTTAADNLGTAALGIVVGNCVTGTLSTTQATTDLTEATNDHYNGRMIVWTSGVLAGQASEVTDYDGATKTLTFNTVTDAPGNGDDFVLV